MLAVPVLWGLDRCLKKLAVERLEGRTVSCCRDRVRFSLVRNEGAFLGFLKERKGMLLLLNLFLFQWMLLFLLPLARASKAKGVKWGVSLLLGGGLGNLWDRIRGRAVVDYIAFAPRFKVHFNLADFAIFAGGILVSLGRLEEAEHR
nr:signal peptidase II [Anaerotalea alkaliphila]